MSSQAFWSTANDCTNDEHELISANEAVVDIATHYRQRAKGVVAPILDSFLRNYAKEMLAKIRVAYLACFSKVRDDPSQWNNYGGQGSGVCLGVKKINEPGPQGKEVFSNLIEVVYSEESLRKWLDSTFAQMCQRLESAQFSAKNIRLGLSVFYGVAAFASLMTKKAEWAAENEVRRVTLNRFEHGVEPRVRINAEGKEIL